MYEDLKGIADETLRCRQIVRGLLEFARQEAPAKVEIDLNKIVSSVVGLVRKQFSFNNITIDTNLNHDMPLIRLDKDQFQQVIVNILMNSMESIERDGEIRMETSYDDKAGTVLLRIKDSGRGIPAWNSGDTKLNCCEIKYHVPCVVPETMLMSLRAITLRALYRAG